jgi:hypothetical protein
MWGKTHPRGSTALNLKSQGLWFPAFAGTTLQDP